MAWKKIPGLNGRVYIPDPPPGAPKKHPCVDCFSCQFCSDERCSTCRGCNGQCRHTEKEGPEERPEAKAISKCLKCSKVR